MNLLQITSSIRGHASQSTRLANLIVKRLFEQYPDGQLTVRDLSRNPHPVLDETALNALGTPAESRNPLQAERVTMDDTLIAELKAADRIVIAVPMYNFSIPVQLKTWIDAVCRAGVTFKYTESGSMGLLTDKQVYLALTRGGIYKDTPADTQTPYLKTILEFMGISDVICIYAEGLALGPENEATAFQLAEATLAQLAG